MLLLGLTVFLSALGLAILIAQTGTRHRAGRLLSTTGFFLVTFGLLWVTAALVPLPMGWMAAAVGVFILTLVRSRQEPGPSVLLLIVTQASAALAFHFTLALLDLSLSTRQFTSDGALLLAALERGAAVPELVSVAVLIAVLVVGACAGRWIGVRSRSGQLQIGDDA